MGAVLVLLSICGANAQQTKEARKERKEEAVVRAKETVADDKYALKTLRDRKADDKDNHDRPGIKADRKAIKKTEMLLEKDRVKKDVAKVKKAI